MGVINLMKPEIPKSIKNGHKNLSSELKAIMDIRGEIGEKAKILDDIMALHFNKEEEYALPPLGFLLALSEDHWEIDSMAAIKMADRLKSKLSELKKDHENILIALHNLKIVGEQENNTDVKQFVKDLKLHASIEDQVLYPATILIGNYLKALKPNQ